MSCKFLQYCPISSEECNAVRKPSECKCYKAVMNVFEAMADAPRSIVYQAALMVYRHHYPKDSMIVAELTVERWMHAEHIQ